MTKAVVRKVSAAIGNYPELLTEIKQRIRSAQIRTAMASNASLLLLYWEIGDVLVKRQKSEGWGAAVLPRLATDLHNELPDVKGFSERNLKRMVQFFREYPSLFKMGPPPVAQLPEPRPQNTKRPPSVAELSVESTEAQSWHGALVRLPWAHNVILIQKVKHLPTRLWYAQKAFEHGWSRDVLSLQIQSRAHERRGKAVTNFQRTPAAAAIGPCVTNFKRPLCF